MNNRSKTSEKKRLKQVPIKTAKRRKSRQIYKSMRSKKIEENAETCTNSNCEEEKQKGRIHKNINSRLKRWSEKYGRCRKKTKTSTPD